MIAGVKFYSPLELRDTGSLEEEWHRSLYRSLLLSVFLNKRVVFTRTATLAFGLPQSEEGKKTGSIKLW